MRCAACGAGLGSHGPSCRYWSEPEPPFADQWMTEADLDEMADRAEDMDGFLNPRRDS